VRDALARDDLPAVARLVPPTTLDYLRSTEGRAVVARLAEGRGSNR
jgi:citrate lyase synthetase